MVARFSLPPLLFLSSSCLLESQFCHLLHLSLYFYSFISALSFSNILLFNYFSIFTVSFISLYFLHYMILFLNFFLTYFHFIIFFSCSFFLFLFYTFFIYLYSLTFLFYLQFYFYRQHVIFLLFSSAKYCPSSLLVTYRLTDCARPRNQRVQTAAITLLRYCLSVTAAT